MATHSVGVHRHASTDEQLYRDVEEVLEGCSELVAACGQATRSNALSALLTLWDGICCYLTGRAKPATWSNMLMRAARKCSPDMRSRAADATFHADIMRRSQPLWRALKTEQLQPLFETPDVAHNQEDGARKRQKR